MTFVQIPLDSVPCLVYIDFTDKQPTITKKEKFTMNNFPIYGSYYNPSFKTVYDRNDHYKRAHKRRHRECLNPMWVKRSHGSKKY